MEDAQKDTEAQEVPTGMRVLETRVEGESLYIELASDNREELVSKGRTFAMNVANTDHEFSAWARAGVEKVSSPVAFDPMDPNNDPYDQDANEPETTWQYRQTLRLTRSPV